MDPGQSDIGAMIKTDGSPLCRSCGRQAPKGANFCPECGAPITDHHELASAAGFGAATAKPSAERRPLTIMFCDLVGSTTLAARLDPEDMRDVINASMRLVTDVVLAHGGYVAQYVGDGALVYFGYPEAAEDDPQRAVDAALEIQRLASTLPPVADYSPQFRVGVATGLVVVGEIVGAERASGSDVAGRAPHLAARLQAIAPAGGVIISEDTRRLVPGLFDLQDRGAVALKGFPEPVVAYEVLRRSRAQTKLETDGKDALSPLVGRSGEFGLLREAWAEARSGRTRVVLISGEPGIGKSRLTMELAKAISAEPHQRIRYYCSRHSEGSPFQPIIDQIERAAGFTRDDTPERKIDKLREAMLAAPREDDLALIAALVSVGGPQEAAFACLPASRRREKTIEALLRQLVALPNRGPLYIVAEDIHWMDPSSLELFDLALKRLHDLPVLLVLTFRPEFHPPWSAPHVRAIELKPLSSENCRRLIRSLRGAEKLPHKVMEQIVDRADCVPLFAEELTKAVLDAGLDPLTSDDSAPSAPFSAIPSTLQASLVARLDRLGSAKRIIQIGSVIGRKFTVDLVAQLADAPEPELQDGLKQLTELGLLIPRDEPSGTAMYIFKHALIQDAAYSSMLRHTRRTLHKKLVGVLEADLRDPAGARFEILAHHAAEAGLTTEAAAYWLQAGRQAFSRSALAEASAHLARAFALLPALPEDDERARTELDVRTNLGMVHMALSGWAAPKIVDMLGPARQLCVRLKDDTNLARCLRGLWQYHLTRGAHATSMEIVAEMAAAADRSTNAELIITRLYAGAASNFLMGNLDAAQRAGEALLEAYDPAAHGHIVRISNSDPRCATLMWASHWLWILGLPDAALQASREAAEQSLRIGAPFNICFNLTLGSGVLAYRREPDALMQRLDTAAAIAESQGIPFVQHVLAPLYRAPALLELGRVEEALAMSRAGLAAWERGGGRIMAPYHLGVQADALGRLGRHAEGLDTIGEAVQLIEDTNERWAEPEVRRIGAALLSLAGRREDAVAEYRLALSLADAASARGWQLRAATGLARLLIEDGEREDAHAILVPTLSTLAEGHETRDVIEARSVLAGAPP